MEPDDDILLYAPIEIIEDYFKLIEEMINQRSFKGIDSLVRQLSKSLVVQANAALRARLRDLSAAKASAVFCGK